MGDINQDPSMEEILASIKRVIAEDGRVPSSRAGRSGQRSEGEPPLQSSEEEDILELSDPVNEQDGLMSQDSAAASRQSLAALAALRQQEDQVVGERLGGDGPLEAVVRDMLRPILKAWLDERLPEMVEDMVAREIARITGKGL